MRIILETFYANKCFVSMILQTHIFGFRQYAAVLRVALRLVVAPRYGLRGLRLEASRLCFT
jgi:hypothetical protein